MPLATNDLFSKIKKTRISYSFYLRKASYCSYEGKMHFIGTWQDGSK